MKMVLAAVVVVVVVLVVADDDDVVVEWMVMILMMMMIWVPERLPVETDSSKIDAVDDPMRRLQSPNGTMMMTTCRGDDDDVPGDGSVWPSE